MYNILRTKLSDLLNRRYSLSYLFVQNSVSSFPRRFSFFALVRFLWSIIHFGYNYKMDHSRKTLDKSSKV